MIHKTAIIDPKAKIDNSVEIGAYSVIGPEVEIGKNTKIQSVISRLIMINMWRTGRNKTRTFC